MNGIDELLARLEAEATARSDQVVRYRDAVDRVLGRLDELAGVRLPQLPKGRRNRMQHGLDNARREVRRALDALAPPRSG